MKTLAGILAAVLLLGVTLAYAQDCGNGCNTTVWQLFYEGNVVSFGDMTEEECEALKAEIEGQTKPFTELTCIEVPVAREEI